jgi:serine/threonine protein kinase
MSMALPSLCHVPSRTFWHFSPPLCFPPRPFSFSVLFQVGPLSLTQVLKLAVDISRGMDYLHQRKIIHRDLKVRMN